MRCKAEVFDEYAAPSDTKLEARPKHPAVFSVWQRQAENGIKIFESLYGIEHGPERRQALDALRAGHEEDDLSYPADYIAGLWES